MATEEVGHICPACGEPAVCEVDHEEKHGVRREDLTWFCLDCLIMKPLCQIRWIECSIHVIAVLLDIDVLERVTADYQDAWVWEGDEEAKFKAEILEESLKRQRANPRITSKERDNLHLAQTVFSDAYKKDIPAPWIMTFAIRDGGQRGDEYGIRYADERLFILEEGEYK